MADLKTKMFKVASGGDVGTPPSPAVQAPDTTYKHRISFDVTDSMYEALKVRAFTDRVPMVELLRMVVSQWCESEGITT